MQSHLKRVLSRWAETPPVIQFDEASGILKAEFDLLQSLSLLKTVSQAASIDCRDCSRRCLVEFLTGADGKRTAFVNCKSCGIYKIPGAQLSRWTIDTTAFLAAIFQDSKLNIDEQIKDHLWLIGRSTWAGRSCELWFARKATRSDIAAVTEMLKKRPKSVVFVPVELSAASYRDSINNPVIALDTVLSFDANGLQLDSCCIDDWIASSFGAPGTKATKPRPKRGERATKIEKLRKELVEHIIAARDHAHTHKEQSGEPELLARPTQKMLAKLTKMTEADVSRCLKDESAKELQLLWKTAQDLEAIMQFKAPRK